MKILLIMRKCEITRSYLLLFLLIILQLEYLRDMVQSVESQSYANWELIIVDDASPDTCCEG
ncbi:glycosyltransferase [Candidatus Minimicrobia vallesae]|uniref:Glycosyltransferase n=1 Tax=Candidatus Minimicrobia vallesae TaxID=2841264 RepID=A0A8F1SAM2_9BACT|nr:glycosyltransferase [Candidatus Minimicrobia vallesae]